MADILHIIPDDPNETGQTSADKINETITEANKVKNGFDGARTGSTILFNSLFGGGYNLETPSTASTITLDFTDAMPCSMQFRTDGTEITTITSSKTIRYNNSQEVGTVANLFLWFDGVEVSANWLPGETAEALPTLATPTIVVTAGNEQNSIERTVEDAAATGGALEFSLDGSTGWAAVSEYVFGTNPTVDLSLTNGTEIFYRCQSTATGTHTASAYSVVVSGTPIAPPVFENLGSMRIDALNEGVKMPNVNFWPTNGGVNDLPFSVEIIAKITTTSGGRTFAHLMTDTFAGGGGVGLFQLLATDHINFILQSSSGNNIKLDLNIGSTYDNTFTHFIFTYDGTESETGLNVWINGVLQTTTNTENGTYGKLATVTTCDLEVAGDSGGNVGVGDFNWARYYDKELDSADVALLYDTGSFPYNVSLNPTLYANVLVDVPFNSLATLADATKGTDGIIYGTPTFTTDKP